MDTLHDLSASDIPSGNIQASVPRMIVPAINRAYDACRDLDSRLRQLERVSEAESGAECPCPLEEEVQALREEIDALRARLGAREDLEDVLPTQAARILEEWGLTTVEDVAVTPDEVLRQINGIGESRLETIRDAIPFAPSD